MDCAVVRYRDNLQSSEDEIYKMSDEYRDEDNIIYYSGLRCRKKTSTMMDINAYDSGKEKHIVEICKRQSFRKCYAVIFLLLISAFVWIYMCKQEDSKQDYAYRKQENRKQKYRKQGDPINIPLDMPTIKSKKWTTPDFSPEKFWGTYRPNVYFGLKTRSESSLVVGLMWYSLENRRLRHWCSENDDLVKYGWLRHDGINFGIHEVVEKTYKFNVSFVKRQGGSYGGDWTARISATPTSARTTYVSFLFYIALEGHGMLKPRLKKHSLLQVTGETPELGLFRLRFPEARSPSPFYLTNLVIKKANIDNLSQAVVNELEETLLWNVGFDIHLINIWDASISMDIIAHWLDLMNIEGWIPREQILGPEAKSATPNRFIVQENNVANPPTLFLGILNLIEINKTSVTFLKTIFPRLEIWFNWLYSSQDGEVPFSYYWKGRDSLTDSQLILYTFASGLDDYPRASHPNSMERHIDLRCWIAVSSRVLAKIAKLIDQDWTEYEKIYNELSDNELLDAMHWDKNNRFYSDFGLHTNSLYINITSKSRVVHADPSLRYIGALGYVSLFPLMLRILNSDSPRLHKILRDLRNEDLLWTKYGIRSLAKKSRFYNLYNTVNDPPHWRGAIWINMNYLILSSLHYYSKIPGNYQKLSLDIYTELRVNLINNMIQEYIKKGYVFEKYDDVTGFGHGSFPFTGWSALIVNIITEKY